MAWLAAQGSTDPQDFETYLHNFPNGMYARQAQQRLEALRHPQVGALPPETQTHQPPPAAPDPIAAQRQRWAMVEASSDPKQFERFLSDYPEGPYTAEALNYLGHFYFNGIGVAKSLPTAASYFQRAAELGSSHGANNLGNMYATGNGVPQDDARAAALYRRGVELGHPDAMTNLGGMLAAGRAGKRDDAQAVELFRRANNANGFLLLAIMTDDGRGTPRDPNESARLYLESLRLGQATSRDRLITQRGKPITADTRRAIQRKLTEQGLYKGPIDGAFGSAVLQGLEKAAGR